MHVTVERSQWFLDVAPEPGAKVWQYDLLIAAHEGKDYGALFPSAGSRALGYELPGQLPPGVSWRETLPGILRWVGDESVPDAVDRARDQRSHLMWGAQTN